VNLYVIYDHPTDYPDKWVVRRWELDVPKEVVGTADSLEEARALIPEGCTNLSRSTSDDPKIHEVWL
jgi:hypothetical protein